MNLQPLLTSSPAIQLHTYAAVLALLLGLCQFVLPRGNMAHRVVGVSWVGLMAVVALSSFFIHQGRIIGIWSPIHLLSVLTLAMLAVAVIAIRRGNVRLHRQTMTSLFVFALLGAGAFTLLPGRIMHAVIFATPATP